MDLLHVDVSLEHIYYTVRMRQSNKNIQRRTFVKIPFNTITLNSIHTVHYPSINISVRCLHMKIHGHY